MQLPLDFIYSNVTEHTNLAITEFHASILLYIIDVGSVRLREGLSEHFETNCEALIKYYYTPGAGARLPDIPHVLRGSRQTYLHTESFSKKPIITRYSDVRGSG